ncbi:MAG: ATP-dependent DNA helicase [Clostridiales bacterium]|nr:ATP-dependent DNA helicase [Clostridiales bacterium]
MNRELTGNIKITEVKETPQTAEVIEAKKIRISVRNLVEFVFRSGDIDNRVGRGVQREAMQQGSRMHRKIQKRMDAEYRAEVSLKHETIMGHYVLSVEGRADGIFRREDAGEPAFPSGKASMTLPGLESVVPSGEDLKALPERETPISHVRNDSDNRMENCMYFIDEIKCMYANVTRLEHPQPVHLAQAKCYAYIFAAQNGLDRMGVQLTYCDLDTETIRRFEEIYSFDDLSLWFEKLIESYRKWADHQYEWNLIRRDSILPLEFPFPWRPGQKKLAEDVYRTIAREKILFLQAPTGTGKTMAVVFPAVKAVGEGLSDKIFYLTAKTITRTVAKEAFDILKAAGYRGRVLIITAKEKICPLEETDCNPVHCPYAKGHYDRVNDAVFELMTTEHDYTRERLLSCAEKHQVCPFEMALDLSLWSDVIICDYNYVFDPNVYLKRFFAEGVRGEYLFLIDEAHNLVERGREMYSADLVKEDFLKMKRLLRSYSAKLASALEKCNRQLLEWKRECERYTVLESVGSFAFSLMRLMSLMDEFLQRRAEFPERKEVTEFYLNLRHFMNMFERLDENYVLYTDFDGDNQFCLHLFCVNPAQNLQECLDRARSSVFFSATLLPVQYYKDLLSARADNYAVYAASSFQKERRLLFVARDVSSLYTRRNRTEFEKIAAYIRTVIQARRGNYIVFFPSYRYMEQVREVFSEQNSGDVDCVAQSIHMREEEREAFIAEFSGERERSMVAFCVLGGIFSEGIDLKHDRLIGVLVVGTGLPQICSRREVLKSYYNGEPESSGRAHDPDVCGENGGSVVRNLRDENDAFSVRNARSRKNGFPYAYQYPGMNKVLQAAGRVIRTAQDYGVIGLLDERFLRRDYQALFPREWDDYRVCSLETLPGQLEDFWEELPQP